VSFPEDIVEFVKKKTTTHVGRMCSRCGLWSVTDSVQCPKCEAIYPSEA